MTSWTESIRFSTKPAGGWPGSKLSNLQNWVAWVEVGVCTAVTRAFHMFQRYNFMTPKVKAA